jgi:exopolysaccharide production protein ExoZ
MDLPPAPPQRRRLIHLQILRGVAASLVVVNHTFTTLAFVGLPQPRYDVAANQIGSMGVAAFFVLSGLLMVRQSEGLFGSVAGALVFAWRRLVRVVPLYWIATLALFLAERHWGWPIPHARGQLLLSLSFLPNFFSPFALQPIVQQGWTLNYEMAFYALFALCLLLPRRWGLALLLIVLLIAFRIGCVHWFPIVESPAVWLNFLTGRVLILFAAGVAIGIAEVHLSRLPRLTLPFSPALLLCLPAAWQLAFPPTAASTPAQDILWLAAAAVVLLCTLGRPSHPGPLTRILILLGDASYSTYLFHLWVMSRAILRIAHSAPQRALSPWVYIAVCLAAANTLGLIVHWLIERPIAAALRRLANFAATTRVRRRLAAPNLGAP